MKVYSIGRENGCDIVINDSTDVISRRHAVLNVAPSGKMTIVDQSHNGTYVNGIRISPNVPFPVTRKDNISFAHVARLDWNIIPKPISPLKYVLIAFAAIILVGGGIFGFNRMFPEPKPVINSADSAKVHQKTEAQIKEEVEDSIKKVQLKNDSITKAKNDSIAKAKRDSVKKANAHSGSKSKIKPEPPKEEKKEQKKFR